MSHSYKTLFSRLPDYQPSDATFQAILRRIDNARTRRLRIRGAIHGVLIVSAIVAFIPTIGFVSDSFSQSGFLQYSSLLMSDSSLIFNSGKELLWSLIETLPLFELGIVTALVFICINSLRRLSSYWSSLSAEHTLIPAVHST